MKIAIPYENNEIFQHFGHAEQFKIYTVEDQKIVRGEVVTPEDVGHEALAEYLKAQGVETLICGGIGEGARAAVGAAGIRLCSGVSGDAEDAVEQFLAGTLSCGTGANCDHHHEEEDSCAAGSCGGCGGCHGCRPPYVETRTFTEIITLDENNFQQEVLDDPALIVIDFWAEWCGPCKLMAPIFDELNAEQPQVKFCKVNVDQQERLAAMFGIESIPTLVVMQDRHMLTGILGVREKAEIAEMIEKCKG